MPTQNNTKFLALLKRAFQNSIKSKEKGSPSFDELMEQSIENESNNSNRRQFLSTVSKAGIAIGLASTLDACNKTADFIDNKTAGGNDLKPGAVQPRIAIIGGGMAGLNCAYQLKKKGLFSTVYEAGSRVGGRILTKTNFIGQGTYTECGGEFIDSDHANMISLANEFGLPLLDTQTPDQLIYARDSFYIDGRYYTEQEVANAFGPYANQIHADVRSLPNNFGFNNYTDAVLRFDQMSISGYLDSIGMPSSSFLRKGIENAYTTEYGREVNDQTAINFLFLFTINPGNNNYSIFGFSDERYKISGGNERLIQALNTSLNGQVVLGRKLLKVARNNANAYLLYFDTGTVVTADIVVCTIPFTLLRSVDLSGLSFPSWKTNGIQNLGYGTNSKLLLGFNSRVWNNYMQGGYIFTNGSPLTPVDFIQNGWENTLVQNTTKFGYTVFQGGEKGLALSLNKTSSFVNQLNQIWPGALASYNGNNKLLHWPSNPLSLGSYGCWRVGQVTSIVGSEGLPIGNFYFAGEHTSRLYQGYMEGAAETGKSVASTIGAL